MKIKQLVTLLTVAICFGCGLNANDSDSQPQTTKKVRRKMTEKGYEEGQRRQREQYGKQASQEVAKKIGGKTPAEQKQYLEGVRRGESL